MKIDVVSEKVILSSIAASVALSAPFTLETLAPIAIDNLSIEPSKMLAVKYHPLLRQLSPQKLPYLHENNSFDTTKPDIDSKETTAKILAEKLYKSGDSGGVIVEIQKKLKDAGYYYFDQDGIFGPQTKNAVIAYQKDHGLVIDGIVGQQTYRHLAGVTIKVKRNVEKKENIDTTVYIANRNTTIPSPSIVTSITKVKKNDLKSVIELKSRDSGNAVKELQRLLKNYGYYRYKIDGSYGPITEAAVRKYQIKNHLLVNGIADQKTISHLKTTPGPQLPSRSYSSPTQRKTGEFDTVTTKEETLQPNTNNLTDYAQTLLGTPYIWGGTTPNGFDCSGFLMYVYKQNGKKIPRTVSEIWNFAQAVDQLQAGDLVFFETYKKGPSHAGIYIGNQQFIHAGTSTGVTISNLSTNYWQTRYLGAKRIK